jgi:hypothetical protein
MSNGPATDRADAPCATAAATRRRKSPEYGAGISSPNDMLRHHCRRSAVRLKLFMFSNLSDRKPCAHTEQYTVRERLIGSNLAVFAAK